MNESSEEEDENNYNYGGLYNSDYKQKRIFLKCNNDLFYPPNICPKWNKDSIRTNTFKIKNILQPIGLRYINKKCKKRYITEIFHFSNCIQKFLAYNILNTKIIFTWKKNGKEIYNYFIGKYRSTPCYLTICSVLKNMRKIIANVYRNIGIIEMEGEPCPDQ